VTRYVAGRLLQAIPLLVGISMVTFGMLQLIPGGPLSSMFDSSATGTITAQDIARMRATYHLDAPIWEQYLRWVGGFITGDWGTSFVSARPVSEVVLERIPATLKVTGLAFLLTVFLALPVGILAAVRQYSWIDYAFTTVAFLGISIPRFWSGLLLLFVLSFQLGWLPSTGLSDVRQTHQGFSLVMEEAKRLVLPVFVMSLYSFATLTRYVRAAMLEVLSQDYLRTARAKGIAETAVVLRHALRNGAFPIVTIIALQMSDLFVGSAIVESIFAIPGTGQLFVQAAIWQDYPVLLSIVMLSSCVVVAANLLADIAYGVLDPRIRYR
jgi:peptide/nickel transport system permease protein